MTFSFFNRKNNDADYFNNPEYRYLANTEQGRALVTNIEVLRIKEKELNSSTDANAIEKLKIIKLINKGISDSIVIFNNSQVHDTQVMLVLLRQLKRIIEVVLNNDNLINVLSVRRNQNQYYANVAISGASLIGGIAISALLPQSILGALGLCVGLSDATLKYLNGFDNYIPSSLLSILHLYAKLTKYETSLTTLDNVLKSGESHYEVLGVSTDATVDEINKGYRLLAIKYHPDKNGGNKELFQKINTAKEILTDNDARYQYDCEIGLRAKYRF